MPPGRRGRAGRWLVRAALPAALFAFSLDIPAAAAEPHPLAEGPASLIERLPDSVLAAVEIRELDRRWPEIQSLPAMTALLESAAGAIGLRARDLPEVAGPRAVIALAPGEGGWSVTPVILVTSTPRAWERVLHASPAGAAFESRGTLWIGPSWARRRIEDMARGDGTCLVDALDRDEVSRRLSPGGLARGWIHPDALKRFLRERSEEGTCPPVDLLASCIAGELDAVRFAGFRRDVSPEGLSTEAVLGYDPQRLPPEVARALEAPANLPALPRALPEGVLLAATFRPEGEAVVPWMTFLSRRDLAGPLRNLTFWREEFEAWSGRDLDRDLLHRLGDRGTLLLLSRGSAREAPGEPHDGTGESARAERVAAAPLEALEVVGSIAIEEEDPTRPAGGDGAPPASVSIEETLLALRAWIGSHVAGRSLGSILPLPVDTTEGDLRIHGLRWWTPLGSLDGPAFAVTPRAVFFGSGEDAVREGLGRLASGWDPAPAENTRAPVHGSLRVSPAMFELASRWLAAHGAQAGSSREPESGAPRAGGARTDGHQEIPGHPGATASSSLPAAVAHFLAATAGGEIDLLYERDAIEIHTRLRLRPGTD